MAVDDCIANHRVFIHDRGGIQRLDELVNVQSLRYSRKRDDTSTCTVVIAPQYCAAQRAVLDRVVDGTGRFEVVIYRGEERAWEGPIDITTDSGEGFQVDASDVTSYWASTVMHNAYSNAYPNIAFTIDRAKLILTTELARKEALGYNLLNYLTYIQTPTDAKTSRVTAAYEKTVFTEIDDLAAKSGMDYTAIGRRVILWDTDNNIGQTEPMDTQGLGRVLQKRSPAYDKDREEHYNLISALHKSIRGSDPDAALYWLARMLEGGEDPLFIARRLVRAASEDIGLADPTALLIANAAKEAYDFLGSPEGELHLAHAVIHLASAPKSNAAYVAFGAARRAAKQTGSLMPPKHILNAPTKLMKSLGYSDGYQYDHNAEEGFSGQDYFPEEMERQSFYAPKGEGAEARIKERLDRWAELRRTRRG